MQEVRNHLLTVNPQQKWTEDREARDSSDRRPPHEVVYWYGDFRDLGCDGKLRLTFYNGHLMSTEFWPSDGAAYMAALRIARRAIPSSFGQTIPVGRSTVRYDSDRIGLHFVWEDSKLEKEFNDWVMKYS
jgi:hypothetical protein